MFVRRRSPGLRWPGRDDPRRLLRGRLAQTASDVRHGAHLSRRSRVPVSCSPRYKAAEMVAWRPATLIVSRRAATTRLDPGITQWPQPHHHHVGT